MNKTGLKKVTSYFYFIITGIIIIPLTLFFAGGTIAENYEGDSMPAPEYLWLIVLWALGFILHFFKRLFWIGIIVALIPIIYFFILVVFPGYL